MLAIPITPEPDRVGVSRRGFLQVGALGVGAATLTLADLFRQEARAGGAPGRKAVIHITLGGGPPHQDTWDLKPDAPPEIRGEFRPIATRVPGLQICEVFPRLARLMDRFAVLRSIVGAEARHDTFQCLSGWPFEALKSIGGRPCMGSVLSRLARREDAALPPCVGLNRVGTWGRAGGAGFLGATHAPFIPDGTALANMKLRAQTIGRLQERRQLQSAFDGLRRDLDSSGLAEGLDAFERRALDVLTSGKLVEALDLSREPDRVRERYGTGKPYGRFILDGSPTANENFLLARRLVEAGVRCVTVPYGRWDSHLDNFAFMRDHGPKLDQALSALIEDLELRGMLDDVTVIAWGEFGRTPRINKDAGRDHWPDVNCALVAGGGMKVGQVIGSTTRYGEAVKDRPIHFQEVLATLYHNVGIDVGTTTLADPSGRPQFLVEQGPIKELVGG